MYPLSGWQMALGELLAPALILTVVQWVLIVLAATLLAGDRANLWNDDATGERPTYAALAISAAVLVGPLNLVSLLIPNAAALLLPGWFAGSAVGGTPRGVEVMGQRLLFVLAQFVALVVALLPALLAAFLVSPLAAAGGVALEGHATLAADLARAPASGATTADVTTADVTTADVTGTLALTGGLPQAVALIGPDGTLALGVTQDGAGQGDITLRTLRLDGRALHLAGSGTDRAGVLDLTASLGLPDLAAASPAVSGTLQLQAHATGRTAALTADVTAQGDVGASGVPRGPLTLTAHASGLPASPDATMQAQGRFDGSPVSLAAAVQRQADGALHATLTAADWKSAHATADLTLPKGATLPLGSLQARMTRLADLEPVLHLPLAGSVTASLATAQQDGRPQARLDVHATGAGLPGEHVGQLALTGTVADPVAHPVAALRLTAEGIDAAGVTGSATASADGPQDALALRLGTALTVSGQPATAQAAAVLDVPGHAVQLRSLAAAYHGEDLRLLAPARITWAPAVAVDRLRLGLQQAVLDLAGRISPTLDLTASLRGVTPDLAKPFVPSLDADGRLAADARLTGTTAAPQGSVRLTADGVRLRTGPGRSVPPASLVATAQLQGHAARLDARLAAGRQLSLTLAGTAPLGQGPLDLHAQGSLDLGITDPILTAGGRRVRGTLALDASVTGSTAQPRIGGTARLSGGEIQDYAQGAHITDITALIAASGDTVRIQSFTGHAGPGTIGIAGSVGVLAPGLPVDLRITAQNARPLASDLLTATIDAALTLHGNATSRLDAGGSVTIERADITVPNALPPSVATLNVIRPGQKPPPAASGPGLVIGLDVTAATKGPIFVRGHGLDAQLVGRLHVGGTSAAPQVSGGFDMTRGSFSLAGTSLTFTRGRVGFDGTGVTNKIDPTLDFEADSTAGSTTATLKVTGYADAPKIALSSSPPLPQDEVLAQILFGQSIKQLSPFQIAEIASALAELSGVGGGDDVLSSLRKGLGLDRLSVGGASSGSGASLEAGKYVAQGVYVGAKEGTDGGTQAQVQVDLTKHLKLESQLGAGGGVPATGITPQNDPGSSIGLKYQFEY